MSTYTGDVKSFQISAAESGTIFDGPARILGVYFNSTAAGGSIELLNSSTSVFKIDVPDGSTTEQSGYMLMPGSGIYCNTSLKYTTDTITEVTVFYG
jgi:hypothetical protein